MATVDLNVVLDNLVVRMPHVTHAMSLSSDGRVLATTTGLPERRRDDLAVVGASMIGLLQAAANVLQAGRVVSSIVYMDGGFMFTMQLSPQVSVLVVASADCDVAQVAQEMAQLSAWPVPACPLGGTSPRKSIEHTPRLPDSATR